MGKLIDLTGQTFKYFTVLTKVPNNVDHSALWKCQCKCGKNVYKTSRQLKAKHTHHSCGCYIDTTRWGKEDRTGDIIGEYTVLGRVPQDLSERKSWVLQCVCGKKVRKTTGQLSNSNTAPNCGCKKRRSSKTAPSTSSPVAVFDHKAVQRSKIHVYENQEKRAAKEAKFRPMELPRWIEELKKCS